VHLVAASEWASLKKVARCVVDRWTFPACSRTP
jgi:hypothetical protein